MQLDELRSLVQNALEDLKAVELKVLDVRDLTSVTDLMMIVTGTSNRHVKALSDNLREKTAAAGVKPLGIEGVRESEWILMDYGDIVVHIMLPHIRATYNLEKLWDKELLEAVASKRPEEQQLKSRSKARY
jgi:ribosome-associated protein